MKLLLALLTVLVSVNANALADKNLVSFKIKRVDSGNSLTLDYDFEGIVKLSNCSGSIIRFAGQPDSANALVLTNGHCIGGDKYLGPKEFKANVKTQREMRVFDAQKNLHKVHAVNLMYATMSGTDAAVYELEETYEDLNEIGVRAFELSSAHPSVLTQIDVVSGYWNRGYSCYIDDFAFKLLEGNWIFRDSIRYSATGCEIIGGTSGSPIIKRGSRAVIGVNNTTNESGKRCALNNPCEVNENGEYSHVKGTSYGQQTYQFYSCLSVDFKIDLTVKGCLLQK